MLPVVDLPATHVLQVLIFLTPAPHASRDTISRIQEEVNTAFTVLLYDLSVLYVLAQRHAPNA